MNRQESGTIPAFLVEALKKAPAGGKRSLKTKMIEECVDRDEDGQWQIVLSNPKFKDHSFN